MRLIFGKKDVKPLRELAMCTGQGGTCGNKAATDEDLCPYQLEVNDNETLCDCCDECRQQCFEDT